MADNHVLLKNACKEIAYQKGKAITFMAKWNYALAGSSCHIHASLWDKTGKKPLFFDPKAKHRSEEHTSELQSLMRISYAVFCLKKKKKTNKTKSTNHTTEKK